MNEIPRTSSVVEKLPVTQNVGNKPEVKSLKQESAPQSIKSNPDSQSDSVGKLKKLKELYASGLITQAEYNSKRSKIMESL